MEFYFLYIFIESKWGVVCLFTINTIYSPFIVNNTNYGGQTCQLTPNSAFQFFFSPNPDTSLDLSTFLFSSLILVNQHPSLLQFLLSFLSHHFLLSISNNNRKQFLSSSKSRLSNNNFSYFHSWIYQFGEQLFLSFNLLVLPSSFIFKLTKV